jgi:hypothetical protein
VRIATRLGITGQVLHALMPRIAQIAMNTSFRMFPDSGAAKGGVGHLQGLGYYVDRNIGIRTVEAGNTGEGMLVAYAYLQLTLADAKTGQVLRRQPVRATQVYAVASKPEISDPWDMLGARQKAEHLRRLLEKQLAREIPALVASR